MKESECYPGKRVGRLTLIEKRRIPNGRWTRGGWLCRCDCGTEKVFRTDSLGDTGHRKTFSCGCYNKDIVKGNTNHRKYETSDSRPHSKYRRLYRTWCHMRQRCENPNDHAYVDYGGRGIKVCEEWHDYKNFKEWAIKAGFDSAKTGLEQSIDRIDFNGDYEPHNCRWADMYEQANNKRNNVKIDINGRKYTYGELAKETGIRRLTIYARYKKGKRGEKLTAPINENMSHRRKEVSV